MPVQPQTPPPDEPTEKQGTAFAPDAARVLARGKLTQAIREAADHHTAEFARLREEMTDLDAEWDLRLTAAWREYNAELARIGFSEE